MASVTINFADALAPRILDAFAAIYGWTATIETDEGTINNPETKGQFAKRMVQQYVRSVVRDYEMKGALAAAKNTTEQAIANEILLT